MKRTQGLFLIVWSLWGHIAYAQEGPPQPDTKLITGKLPNGLTYYIRHNENPKGYADFYLVQKVGSIQETDNQRGLAHFLEHMAFNGTKHFPGNTLVSELEKKGIKFGSHINASTEYDQTIYKLISIPVTRQGIVDTALLVLHDWSGFITNNDSDIEAERGVIREEWRTRNTGSVRVLANEVFPAIYAGTPYANRLPIGTMEVINNFTPSALRDYYKKWYRPDLQAIVITGDIDADSLEEKIRNCFADIPAPVDPAQRVYYQVPANEQPIVVVATDPEINRTTVQVSWKMNETLTAQPAGNRFYTMAQVNRLIVAMLNNRLSRLSKKANAPFLSAYAGIGEFQVTPATKALELNITPVQNDSLEKALHAVFIECERMRRFGFTAAELEKVKKGELQLLEKDYVNRNNRRNMEYTNAYIQLFLHQIPAPASEWQYHTVKDILTGLTIDTLNKWAAQYIHTNNMVVVITGPEMNNNTLPGKETVLNSWKEAGNSRLEAYVAPTETDELAALHPEKGRVVKTGQAPFGYVQWTLSNGIKVRLKNTHYTEDEVYLYGYSPGGYSRVNLNDLPSALAVNAIAGAAEVPYKVDGRASVQTTLGSYKEEVAGVGTVRSIEVLLQLVYMKMTGLKKDTVIFDNYMRAMRNQLKDHVASPKEAFGDTLNRLAGNRHPRSITLKEAGVLNKVDYDKVLRIYKERFANPADFTFFITGNVEPDSVRDLVTTWLGGLPSLHTTERPVDHGMYPPAGGIKKHFTCKMKVPQSTVTLVYSGKMPLNMHNYVLMSCLSGMLNTRYLEEMREKEGGTYGAYVNGSINNLPAGCFTFQVNFDCDPGKKDRLMKILYGEIEKSWGQAPDPALLNKVKTGLLKSHQATDKSGRYWTSKATTLFVYGLDDREFDRAVSAITPAMIRDFAGKVFKPGNSIEVVMDPAP